MYAVALCTDQNYLLPALVTLTSLATATPRRVRAELVVSLTSPDLTTAQGRTVTDLAHRLGFAGCVIRQVRSVPAPCVIRHSLYITAATYLRFAIDPASVSRPFVVYLDADLIVLDDLTDGFDRVGAGLVGAVVDELVRTIGRDEALPGFASTYPHHIGKPYYNAGALWLATDDLTRLRSGAIDCLRRYTKFIFFNDQDALNLWLLKTQSASPLSPSYNRFELGRFRERSDWLERAVGPAQSLAGAKVVHFVGSRKPWLSSCPGTDTVATYRGLLADTRRLLRRLGDLTLDLPSTSSHGPG